jgi:hypothetical protein
MSVVSLGRIRTTTLFILLYQIATITGQQRFPRLGGFIQPLNTARKVSACIFRDLPHTEPLASSRKAAPNAGINSAEILRGSLLPKSIQAAAIFSLKCGLIGHYLAKHHESSDY